MIAPDFPGHGDRKPGGGDGNSSGGLASGLRDLLAVLGHDRATLVGHSLGGGVAMQFTYQFPEIVERLVLVSSGRPRSRGQPGPARGGASRRRSVHRLYGIDRGAGRIRRRTRARRRRPAPQRRRRRGRPAATPRWLMPAAAGRSSATLSAVVGTDGQRVAATDRLYLAASMPLLIVWGST